MQLGLLEIANQITVFSLVHYKDSPNNWTGLGLLEIVFLNHFIESGYKAVTSIAK